jgi:hypothetical protein
MAFITKSIARFALLVGFAAGTSAGWFTPARAADAVATARATIVAPMAIAKKSDLAFASVTAHPMNSGTVVVGTNGGRACGKQLICSGLVAAGSFEVIGGANQVFAITLPTSVKLSSGAHNMTVDSFKSSPAASAVLASDGKASIFVGATLHVGPKQPFDVYNGSFIIYIDYE